MTKCFFNINYININIIKKKKDFYYNNHKYKK